MSSLRPATRTVTASLSGSVLLAGDPPTPTVRICVDGRPRSGCGIWVSIPIAEAELFAAELSELVAEARK